VILFACTAPLGCAGRGLGKSLRCLSRGKGLGKSDTLTSATDILGPRLHPCPRDHGRDLKGVCPLSSLRQQSRLMPEQRPAIPAELERSLMIEAGYRCAVCKETSGLVIDHIVEWAKVLKHEFNNMIVLCAVCHARRLTRKVLLQSSFLNDCTCSPSTLSRMSLCIPSYIKVAHQLPLMILLAQSCAMTL
jgi:5-methylcytosine-specific restriction endonuclease McrA